jgi:hypothetical protein
MQRYVEITFDCLPLRSISRLDIPIDASPRYRQRCESIKAALETHGSHNSYYLYNAGCIFHLTNTPDLGMLEFRFEGTLLTDADDLNAIAAHLNTSLERETCDWLTEPVVAWFKDTVPRAVMAEFDRYISAGDLDAAKRRIAALQAKADQSGGYMGMYL